MSVDVSSFVAEATAVAKNLVPHGDRAGAFEEFHPAQRAALLVGLAIVQVAWTAALVGLLVWAIG